jgi:hypothetical protein
MSAVDGDDALSTKIADMLGLLIFQCSTFADSLLHFPARFLKQSDFSFYSLQI